MSVNYGEAVGRVEHEQGFSGSSQQVARTTALYSFSVARQHAGLSCLRPRSKRKKHKYYGLVVFSKSVFMEECSVFAGKCKVKSLTKAKQIQC